MQHLITLPVDSPRIASFMEECEQLDGVEKRRVQTPYITLHRPLAGIRSELVQGIVRSEVSNVAKRPLIQFEAVRPFGLRYVTLPVVAPHALSRLWTNLHDRLSRQSGYQAGPYDEENILHITVATVVASKHGEVWPLIKESGFVTQLAYTPISVELRSVDILAREGDGGMWWTVRSFPLSR